MYILAAYFYGDPHITTLDGLKYTFNGVGEYVFLKSNSINIQIRATQAKVGENKNNMSSYFILTHILINMVHTVVYTYYNKYYQ